ncbi:hypothetical protein Trydic_g17774 [Trypoxylus dichotomus]
MIGTEAAWKAVRIRARAVARRPTQQNKRLASFAIRTSIGPKIRNGVRKRREKPHSNFQRARSVRQKQERQRERRSARSAVDKLLHIFQGEKLY